MKKHSNYLHPIFTKSYLPHIQYIRKKKNYQINKHGYRIKRTYIQHSKHSNSRNCEQFMTRIAPNRIFWF